jgi:hypothetical protein
LKRRKMDLTLQTTGAKARTNNTGVGEFFGYKVLGMAIGTLYIKWTKGMKCDRFCIWLSSRWELNWNMQPGRW